MSQYLQVERWFVPLEAPGTYRKLRQSLCGRWFVLRRRLGRDHRRTIHIIGLPSINDHGLAPPIQHPHVQETTARYSRSRVQRSPVGTFERNVPALGRVASREFAFQHASTSFGSLPPSTRQLITILPSLYITWGAKGFSMPQNRAAPRTV